ncbi:MAG: ChaN family lipoprotein [Candidatus Micrarchaeota archaeon]|nr:ChaN family lipoprotein [Candidatus Micrarchaeota archaeon]
MAENIKTAAKTYGTPVAVVVGRGHLEGLGERLKNYSTKLIDLNLDNEKEDLKDIIRRMLYCRELLGG